MKRVVWSQVSKIILFFFNFALNRKSIQSIYGQLLDFNEASLAKSENEMLENCSLCKLKLTLRTKNTDCSHLFCYFCIMKLKNEKESCPMY